MQAKVDCDSRRGILLWERKRRAIVAQLGYRVK